MKKIYKNGDRCPCCGQVLEGKSEQWLEEFSNIVWLMDFPPLEDDDAEG